MAAELRRVNALVSGSAEGTGRTARPAGHRPRRARPAVGRTGVQRRSRCASALSSPKARGQWGERMAEDVLRLAGLVEGVNYRKQTAIPGGTIPDFTFLLPWRALPAHGCEVPRRQLPAHAGRHRTTPSGTRHGTAFGRDVRDRIRELSGRGYIEPGQTLDFVLAFIPNEAVYGFIHEQDPALVDDALRQRVVLCSPFTLFAVLAVIRQSVEHAALERTSDEILSVLGGFSQQWDKLLRVPRRPRPQARDHRPRPTRSCPALGVASCSAAGPGR